MSDKRGYATHETNFKKYCQAKGFTAEYIAEMIGCSKSTVYSYWRGVRFPNRKRMKIMEEKLNIDRKMFDL